jgi:hypothetical protein
VEAVFPGTPLFWHESPSLAASADKEHPAYELKFVLTEGEAREVEARVRGRLVPDPHADPSRGHSYQTTSLYCDTAEFDVFHRRGGFRRRKHRLRRYDHGTWVFLERKSKWAERVRKRRTRIPDADLHLLAHPMSTTTWPGHWFHRHLVRRQLLPVCRIAYERVALVGDSEQGPVRLTFDRHVCGVPTSDWNLDGFEGGLPVLTDKVICEFKYRTFLPVLFKDVIQALQLSPSPVSKYRTFLRASGRVEDGRAGDA